MSDGADDLEAHVRALLEGLGEDPDREGLARTPARVVKSLRFLTQGYGQKPSELINDAAAQGIGLAVLRGGTSLGEDEDVPAFLQ